MREARSGKIKSNTLERLTVICKAGEVIFIITEIPGGLSYRGIWTSCDLYLNAEGYYSEGEWVALDGGFMGESNFMNYNLTMFKLTVLAAYHLHN